MAYYMNKSVPAKRGDIFYISNSKCYATDPSNTEGRPAIVVSSDKLNEHADVVEVVYLTTKEKRLMPTHAEVLCKIPSTALCETIYTVNKDRLGDSVYNLIIEKIQYEVGHRLSRKKAEAIWNRAYEDGHSFGFYEIRCRLSDLIDLAITLLGGDK